MKKFLLAIGLAIVSLVAPAKTFTLKSSLSEQDFNWADGNNYVDEPYPGPAAGDTIVIPSGVIAKVNAAACAANGVCGVCEIHIEAGGIVELWWGDKSSQCNNYFGKLTGSGTVRNSWSNRQDIRIRQSCEFDGKFVNKSEYSSAAMNYSMENGVTFAFTDPDQTFNGSPLFRDTSTLKIYRCFPEKPSVSGASVFGRTGNFNFGTRSTVLYVGAPGQKESVSRSYWGGSYITYDCGAYGGFTMSGYTTPSASQRVFTLTGSNTVLSTFYGNIDRRATYPGFAYIRKEGSGTWLLKTATNNSGGGVVDVHEGTLQIDSLAERGVNCSLGLSTNLFRYGTSVKAADAVDYAVILGGGRYPAVLEYVGNTAASSTTRPLIVTNAGTIASSLYPMGFSDISAAGPGTHTLTLAGTNEVVNSAGMVADGTRGGKLNIVKEGSSTWNLQASGDITGTLKVKGGKLSVQVPDRKYRWYRVWITENAYGSTRYDTTYSSPATGSALEEEKGYLQFAELALYDAEGNNVSMTCKAVDRLKPRQIAPNGDYSVMTPGEVAYGRLTTFKQNTTNGFFDSISDGKSDVTKTCFTCGRGGIMLSKPDTWVPYVFRLPAEAGSVTRIDIVQSLSVKSSAGNNRFEGRCPTAFRVDASADGLNWDENIARCEAMELIWSTDTKFYWLSDGSEAKNVALLRPACGWEMERTEAPEGGKLENHYKFSSISVANGGIFESAGGEFVIDNIELDASAQAGKFVNVRLPDRGTLNVINYAAGTRVLPFFVGNLATRENLMSWTVLVNGKLSKRPMRINADGMLEFVSEGFKILYRQ